MTLDSTTAPAVSKCHVVAPRSGSVNGSMSEYGLASPALLRVWWTRTLSVLLGLLIQVVVALPFGLAGVLVISAVTDGEPGRGAVVAVLALSALGEIVAGMITAPFLAGVLALLYLDRRMRAEGLDFVLRRQERVQQPASRPPIGGSP